LYDRLSADSCLDKFKAKKEENEIKCEKKIDNEDDDKKNTKIEDSSPVSAKLKIEETSTVEAETSQKVELKEEEINKTILEDDDDDGLSDYKPIALRKSTRSSVKKQQTTPTPTPTKISTNKKKSTEKPVKKKLEYRDCAKDAS